MVFKPPTFHGEDETEFDPKIDAGSIEEAQVAEALARAGRLDASDVTVTLVGTKVVLRGSVAFPCEIE